MPRLLSLALARCANVLSQVGWQVHSVAIVVHDRRLTANGLKQHALRRRRGTRSSCSARATRVRSKC